MDPLSLIVAALVAGAAPLHNKLAEAAADQDAVILQAAHARCWSG